MQTFKPGDKIKWKSKGEKWGDDPEWHNRIYKVSASGKAYDENGGYIYLDSKSIDIVKVEDNEMKTWEEMTDEEKGALLLAEYEGKIIQYYSETYDTWLIAIPPWEENLFYRIKPEPKVRTVEVFGFMGEYGKFVWGAEKETLDTHKITFNIINGELDCNSIKMEKI